MKTNLGVTAGLLGAAAYFLGLFGGWIPVLLIAGYVLLNESNEWLRQTVVKAAVIVAFFSVLSACISFIPNAISLIDDLLDIFNETFSVEVVSDIVVFLGTALMILEKILFLVLGFMALSQKTIRFGPVDKLISKHMART